MAHRINALNCTREDVAKIAEEKFLMNLEHGRTSRVVFGSEDTGNNISEQSGWKVYNPIDFLSSSYFDKFNDSLK